MHWAELDGRRATAVALLALASASSGAACHRGGKPDNAAPAPSASAAVDTLAPGELVDGPYHAFELKLPVGVEIREAFSSVVYAWGPVDPMQLANYLRAQVKGGSINAGAAATLFDHVTVPANAKRVLRIRVDSMGQGKASRVEVRDITPPQVPPAADDAERWRRAGLTPDGKLLDPTHLH